MMFFSTPDPLTDADKVQIMQRGFVGMRRPYAKHLRRNWRELCERYTLHRHYKGGVYLWTGEAKVDVADILVPYAIYEHIWPHAHETYARPRAEFDQPGRFVRITP